MEIKFNFNATHEDSNALSELNDLIRKQGRIETKTQVKKGEGEKADAMLVIEIVSLVLTGVSTLITVLDYWNSKHPKYSITLKIGEDTFVKENMSQEEFEKAILAKQENPDSNAKILIGNK